MKILSARTDEAPPARGREAEVERPSIDPIIVRARRNAADRFTIAS